MNPYADIDDIIAARVKLSGSEIFTEWAGEPARFFHLSGDPPFDHFQISIAVPKAGRTKVTACAIDTNDNTEEEMNQTWEGPTEDIDSLLRVAMTTVEGWKARKRISPNPPSPW